MKKFFIYFAVAFMALTAVSCQGERGPMGPQGPAGSANISTVDLKVNAADWQWDSNGKYFYAQFPVNQITEEIYDYGTIACYREYNYGTKNAYQISLPEVKHIETEVDGAPYYYQQTIDYSFGVGFVEIVLTISDYFYETSPEAMNFRLNLMW